MAYNPTRDSLAHLRRIVTGLIDFKGRSSRTEVWVFLLVVMAINAVALILTAVVADGFPDKYGRYLGFVPWLFLIPLFARRLHDQDRSGWFALIVPVSLGLQLYGQILYDARQLPIPELGYPFNVAEIMLVLAFWAFLLWPGTEGANRFGPDPHLDPQADLH